MTQRLAARLADNARRTFTGRETEIARLLTMFEESAPPVWFVEGIAGIGKSRLLAEFGSAASGQGAAVVCLDCRTVEPTAETFLEALAQSTGQRAAGAEETVDRLAAQGRWAVLILDSYDAFLLLDSWMRQTFLPMLTGNLRVVLATRHAPGIAWTGAAEWSGLIGRLSLGPLSSDDAMALLTSAGIDGEAARNLNRVARGHPLALQLLIANPDRITDSRLQAETLPALINELAQTYLADVPDARTRSLLETASVVRRMTRPLLGAMLPDEDPIEAFDLLGRLPFVDQRSDGFVLNESVQTALAGWLRTAAPDQYARFRRAAWRHMRSREAESADLWRETADRLFLLENPHVRDGFFPSGDSGWPVDPARPDDWPAMLDICREHEGLEAQALLELLWQHAPDSFKVIRDDRNGVAGYSFSIPADETSPELLAGDPVLRAWASHLRRHPLPSRQRAVFGRTWLGRDAGEGSSPVQAAIWLHAKRMYMELRPRLRRMYVCQRDFSNQDAALCHLGFVDIPEADVTIDGSVYQTRMLDFGSGSVDGWLSGLIAAELSIDDGDLLDEASRALVIDGQRVGLTKLEFAVLQYLLQRQGEAVSRTDLLADIWGTDYQGGSNVVDAVIRGLRKKLAAQSAMLESVHGVGYRIVVSH